ncbi:dipeptidase [candidate division KSB1 bacterium]|nr:dipeptidase [candidate division KSB1 bacterium]
MQEIRNFIAQNRGRFEQELFELLRIPSVSNNPDHKADMEQCARALAQGMEGMGLKKVSVHPTKGHPIVTGEWMGAEGKPTVLIYGHYDVQPEDPIEEWESPPFEPTVREGQVYARGSVDDKGQFYTHFKAIEAYLRVKHSLPVNVKLVIEGEEEIGSENLRGFIKIHRESLKADYILISDTPMFGRGMPSLCYGLRGLAYMEVEVKGPSRDLHSGSFGGAVANPANVLARIISALVDDNGRVTIPGFYDDVIPLTDQERKEFASLPLDEAAYQKELGVPSLSGERGFTTLERVWARPTLDVNGIMGGFTGEGAKTIIPASAKAKISMRLVPNQDSDKIAEGFEAHVKKLCPPTVTITIQRHHGGNPFLAPLDNPGIQAAGRALEKGFEKRPVFIREGGSIPIVATFDEILGKPCILMGFGLPDENSHAPNEKMDLDNFYRGILSSAHFLQELAES